MKRLLLLSNSTMAGEPYLQWAVPYLAPFLEGAGEVLFVPYAAVGFSWDDYTRRVADALPGTRLTGLHTVEDKRSAIAESGAIIVGGGNTFSLLRQCQQEDLLPAIRSAVAQGARYAGWSAGANLACPTIKTTNDMPIEATDGLDALGLVPFQINPHFTDQTIAGHGGESRSQRLHEFTVRNPQVPVLALPEGMLIEVDGETQTLRGHGTARRFLSGADPTDLAPGPLST